MISNKTYDFLFEGVNNLAHYPWIGEQYPEIPNKLLIIGDSHYTVDKNGEFCQEEFDRCLIDKYYTRVIVNDTIGQLHIWNMFRGLYALFGITPYDAEERFWKKIAFYNFVQTPMKQRNAKPSDGDFRVAWHCFIDVVDILKPDFCLFIGTRGWRSSGCINQENRGHVSIDYDTIKISGCFPWKASIETINGIKTHALAIHHTSQGFSPTMWRNYIDSINPDIIGII